MKVNIVSLDKDKVTKLKKKISKLDFTYSKNPDVVISLGGDGTFFYAERKFPSIPKILVRDKNICIKCHKNDVHSIETLLKKLSKKKFKIKTLMKLVTKSKGKKLIAVNDIVIRNKDPSCAIRFSLKAGDKVYKNLIGDGIVIATPFGSTGYFESITRKTFSNGIGIAFNNCIIDLKPLILNENSKIEFKLLREKATLSADNNKKIITLDKGNKVVIEKYKDKSKIMTL